MLRKTATLGILTAALLLTGFATASAGPGPVAEGPTILGAGASSAIPGSYVVKLKDNSTLHAKGSAARANALAAGHKGKLRRVWDTAPYGFAVTMTADEAKKLAADPDVEYVQQEQRHRVSDTQEHPSYNLDRIDQHTGPLDEAYTTESSGGASVTAYIVDSGVKTNHPEFGGRATSGFDFADNDADAQDCSGHGSHVAGTVGGATYGVAKKVHIVAVRVFDCTGTGSDTPIVDGIKWVIANAIRPAVINLSLGAECTDASGRPTACPPGTDQLIIDQEKAAIAAGIPVVTAAGNQNSDACNNPVGAAGGTINVGATDRDDRRFTLDATHGSNFGFCVDIWAPGKDILSIGGVHQNPVTGALDPDPKLDSGTSMAAPHVTGAVALLMDTPQFAAATPAAISAELDRRATVGQLIGLDNDSPNKLLFTNPPPVTGGSPIALARNTDGTLTLAGVNKAGNLLVGTQTAANAATWGSWIQSVGNGWFSVGAEPNADGRIELGALTWTRQVWRRRQFTASTNNWTGLTQLNDGPRTSVAVARNSTGRLEMVAANDQGEAFYRMQTDAGALTWTPWTRFTFSGRLRSITAETRTDGKIVVAAVDNFGRVFYTTQTVAGTETWSSITQIIPPTGARTMREIALARNKDGTLELTGTDGIGGVWHSEQINGNWSNWAPLSTSKVLRHIAAEANADGRVQVVGVDNTGALWQSAQNTPTSSVYSNWTRVDNTTLLRP